jgi:hypothetical protein
MPVQAAPKTEKGKKNLQVTKTLFGQIKQYLSQMHIAKKDGSKLVVWIGGPQLIPTEILHAMDMLPQQIDSMAAVFAAKQLSERFIEATEHTAMTYAPIIKPSSDIFWKGRISRKWKESIGRNRIYCLGQDRSASSIP